MSGTRRLSVEAVQLKVNDTVDWKSHQYKVLSVGDSLEPGEEFRKWMITAAEEMTGVRPTIMPPVIVFSMQELYGARAKKTMITLSTEKMALLIEETK